VISYGKSKMLSKKLQTLSDLINYLNMLKKENKIIDWCFEETEELDDELSIIQSECSDRGLEKY